MKVGSEPAFPLITQGYPCHTVIEAGLTKREIFAKAAMQGLLSTDEYSNEIIIEQSICIADALLAELERTKDE